LLLGAAPPLESFCYGKKTSGGCTPKLEWSGAPSLSVGDELTVSARSLPPRAPTVLSWSLSGLTWPNNNGPMCLTPPLVRAVAGGSGGGPGSCSGGLDFTFSRSYLAAFGLTAGSDVFVQAWVRDPGQAASRPVATTYGLRFTVWP
jgi:hypothetical protein